jgi:hypothetical protein
MPVVLLYQKVHAIDTDGGLSIYPRTLARLSSKPRRKKERRKRPRKFRIPKYSLRVLLLHTHRHRDVLSHICKCMHADTPTLCETPIPYALSGCSGRSCERHIADPIPSQSTGPLGLCIETSV